MLRMKWLLPTPAPPRTAITRRCWRGNRLSGLTLGLFVVVIFQSSFSCSPSQSKGGSRESWHDWSSRLNPVRESSIAKLPETLTCFRAGVKQNFICETAEPHANCPHGEDRRAAFMVWLKGLMKKEHVISPTTEGTLL
jgi:hypothetical protein